MADNFKFAQLQPFSLAGSGAVAGATSITLKSMNYIDGTPVNFSNAFGTKGFATIEPGQGTMEEQISFTGITQNSNGTATLTGIKTVLFISPYTETSGLAQTHAGSTTLIISNTSGFYNALTAKDDDETITGTWTFTNPNYPRMDTATPAPTADEQLATKKYVDDTAIAGAPDASTTIKGITKLSVTPVSPTNPIAVGNNDPRVPAAIPITVSEGGTGLTTLSTNRILAGGTTATGNLQQVGAGTSVQVLHGNASGLPTFSAVDLTADVTGVLPASNGGTGKTTGGTSLIAQSSVSLVQNITDTTERTLLTVAIPANTLGTTNVVRVMMKGTILNGGASVNDTLRLKYGSTTVNTFVVSGANDGNTYNFVWTFNLYATGATNSQTGKGILNAALVNATTGGAASAPVTILSSGTATEDSTGSLNFIVTTQLASATNPPTLTITDYTIEKLA